VRRSFPHPACATHSDTTHEVCRCPTQLRSHSFLPPFVLLAEGVWLVKARSSESHALPSMLLYARPPDGTTQPACYAPCCSPHLTTYAREQKVVAHLVAASSSSASSPSLHALTRVRNRHIGMTLTWVCEARSCIGSCIDGKMH
jgi:hypothetical protein